MRKPMMPDDPIRSHRSRLLAPPHHNPTRPRRPTRSGHGTPIAVGLVLALWFAARGYPVNIFSLSPVVALAGSIATLSAAILASPLRQATRRLADRLAPRLAPHLAARRRDAALFRRLATLCCMGDFPCRQERVATLVCFLARKAGMQRRDRTLLAIASTLHRTGFVSLPCHPGGDHGETARRAAEIAVRLLDGPTRLHRAATEMARAQDESWDGAGSPHGLAGDDIPFPARLLQVALALDALLPRTGRRLDCAALAAIAARIEAEAGRTLDPALASLPSRHLGQLERLLAARRLSRIHGLLAACASRQGLARQAGSRSVLTPA